jgi:hypothetical protein
MQTVAAGQDTLESWPWGGPATLGVDWIDHPAARAGSDVTLLHATATVIAASTQTALLRTGELRGAIRRVTMGHRPSCIATPVRLDCHTEALHSFSSLNSAWVDPKADDLAS